MKSFIKNNKNLLAGIACCIAIAAVTMSFQPLQFAPLQQFDSMNGLPDKDTIPEKKKWNEKLTMKEYDELMSSVDDEMKKAFQEIKAMDAEKISKELAESLKQLDIDKIKLETDKAMRQIDMAALQNDMSKAIQEVEWAKVNKDVVTSLNHAKKAIEEINMNDVHMQIASAKAEVEKSKAALEKIDFEGIMKEAGKGMQEAKQMLLMQKQLFNEMEKEGLIDSKKGFTIEFKDKSLFIDGKKQTDSVRDKYRKYIPGDNYKISIEKE